LELEPQGGPWHGCGSGGGNFCRFFLKRKENQRKQKAQRKTIRNEKMRGNERKGEEREGLRK